MHKLLLGLFLSLVFLLPGYDLNSQEDCSKILEKAEILFDQGVIEDIPNLLSGCLDHGFTRQERQRAMKLIILAYLFDNDLIRAENQMRTFIRQNPEYQIQADDPPEFSLLFSNFNIMPNFSVGLFTGGNMSSLIITEQYGISDKSDQEQYASTTPEFMIGATVSWFLRSNLELNLEALYTRTSFGYSNMMFDFAEFFMRERHERIEVPLSLTYDLSGGRLHPYLRAGISLGFITAAHAEYRSSHYNQLSDRFETVASKDANIRNMRNSGVISGILGGGIKLKIPRGQIYLDLRYWYGISQLANDDSRWDQETVFRFHHADGNFHIDNLSFSIGYRYLFYKSTRN